MILFSYSIPVILLAAWLAVRLYPSFRRFARWLWLDLKRVVAFALGALAIATAAIGSQGIMITLDFMVSPFPMIFIWPFLTAVALILSWLYQFDEEGELLPSPEEQQAHRLLGAAIAARDTLTVVSPLLADEEARTLVDETTQRLHQAIAEQRQISLQ